MELLDLDDFTPKELLGQPDFNRLPAQIRDAYFARQYCKTGFLSLQPDDFTTNGGWADLTIKEAEDLNSAFRVEAVLVNLPILRFRLNKPRLRDGRREQLQTLADGGFVALVVQPRPDFYCQYRLVGYRVENVLRIYAGTPYYGLVGSIALGGYALASVVDVPGLAVDSDALYHAAAPAKPVAKPGVLVTT
jgi:hypothetical protein